MTVPGLLHYYPSKVDLLFATLAEWERIQTDALGVADVETVLDSGRAILERNLEVPGMMRLRVTLTAEATSEEHPAHARMTERYRKTEQFYVESIEGDVRAGILSASLDVVHAARALIALSDGLQSQYLLNPKLDLLSTFEFAARALLTPDLNRITHDHDSSPEFSADN
jgi:AcrR family transcriptional regulator